MNSVSTKPAPFSPPDLRLHEPFLHWAAGRDGEIDGDLGLGAFLTMRVVDQFTMLGLKSATEAVAYQCAATLTFVEGIRPQTNHSAMLREIAVVAEEALRVNDRRLLFAPLLAFAYCLEEGLRLREALDVLDTALQLSDGRVAEEEINACLHRGRVLRNIGKLGEAREAYDRAGAMARSIGDRHSELLSQIGRGVVARFVGNLPESERLLRGVMAEAHDLEDRDAEGRACHDLAGALYHSGRTHEAVCLAFRAVGLYETAVQQAWALCDTGTYLMEINCLTAACNAFSLARNHHALPLADRVSMELEILKLHYLVGDRVSFEYSRRTLDGKRDQMSPEQHLDLEIKLGAGYSHFGEFKAGEAHLKRAITLAEEYGMNERIFYAEQQLKDTQERLTKEPIMNEAQISGFPLVQETADQLKRLVAASNELSV